ncbi:hypothetical protein CMK18_11910 [Candidatus Poribacteria bacterium]|nr:hypothetical protein [Candidatus Poribacteria bacterium]
MSFFKRLPFLAFGLFIIMSCLGVIESLIPLEFREITLFSFIGLVGLLRLVNHFSDSSHSTPNN